MTSRVRALIRLLVVVVVLAAAAVPESWALQRSSTVTTWLNDAGVHLLGDFNGELYFVSQGQLWKTNGTPAGTVLVTTDASPLVSFQQGFCPVAFRFFARAGTANGLIFFSADDGVHGQELWASDGTPAGTRMVSDLDPAGSSAPHDFVAAAHAIFFDTVEPCCGPATGIWRSDGTEAGTAFHAEQRRPLGDFGSFYVFALDGQLWRSDGTAPGTVPLAVIDPGGGGAALAARDTGKVYFVAAGPRLWVTDGTSAGTVPLLDLADFNPAMACEAGVCYFLQSGSPGSSIWRTDGTPGGTAKVADISDQHTSRPILVAGTAFFTTARGVWKTDGTLAGTGPIFSDPNAFPEALLLSAGDFFFVVFRDGPQRELWRSDGAAAGTRMVADLGTSMNSPLVVDVDGTLVLGAWGPVLTPGTVSTDVWRVEKFDRAQDQLVLLAELARNAVHCPTPTCSCALSRPEQSAVVGRHWYYEALDPMTLTPRLGVATNVYFLDVAPDYWAFSWVEALADAGLTAGCGSDTYCPLGAVSRAQMAVFLLRGLHGASFVPPAATGTMFTDVPASHPFAPWIEQLAREGITGGCSASPAQYCPDAPTTRAAMAVFLLRAMHGAGFAPPAATGTMFTDVPASHPFAAWIEQLAREGITGGCGPTTYCPDATVTRDQMAVFLVRAFGLPI